MLPDGLRRAEFAPLWRAVHDRLSSGRAVDRVRVGPLDRRQREALAGLLGADRLPADHVTVSVARLDAVLEPHCGMRCRDIVEELIGPVQDRALQRERAQRQRAALWEWFTEHPVVRAQPALAGWAEQVRRGGLPGGTPAAAGRLLDAALHVLHALPAPGTPLPAFAEAVLGDPRALEPGGSLSGLVLRALAEVHGVPLPASDGQRRALWRCAGIGEPGLPTAVLSAGMQPVGGRLCGEIMRSCTASGHAASTTLDQLRDAGRIVLGEPDVWVVQEPAVLERALRRFGRTCPPLVCTSGWPNGAAMLLLRTLRAAGARLHHHGDFDGEGLRIAAYVQAKAGAVPWRMSTADYLAALDRHPAGPGAGRITDAPWDAALAPALRENRVAVPELRVADELLDEAVWRTP
ncbi:TIGR02679 family protein [Saccharopolyspora gregorii]|uniref:TIGR02679 family protein n=1 Tax=Saccharopolyspora gregorii TaxID=33914 RepID=A0ABP6S1E5_9PSEU